MLRRHLGLLAVVLATVPALGGCGGDDDGGDAESWANGVCSDLGAWVTDVEGAIESVTGQGLNLDTATIRDAVSQATDATDQLVDDLGERGAPDVEAGEQAKEELDNLREELRDQAETVQQALDEDGGALELASAVGAALTAGANQLKESFENLQGVDPGGELDDAFRNADDCDSLREQIEDIRS